MTEPSKASSYPSRLGDPEGHLRYRNAEMAEMFKHVAKYWSSLADFALDPQYDYPFDAFMLNCIGNVLRATNNIATMMIVLNRSNDQVAEYLKYTSKLAEDASGPMTDEIENWLKSRGPDAGPDAGQS